jgi:hypothetical protein
MALNENKATNGGVDLHGKHPRPTPKAISLTNGRVLRRPRQQKANAPVAGFATAGHMMRTRCLGVSQLL